MTALSRIAGQHRRARDSPYSYVLACLHCGSALAHTERVGDAEVAVVEAHLRAEHGDEFPVDRLPADRCLDFAEVFGHVRVKTATASGEAGVYTSDPAADELVEATTRTWTRSSRRSRWTSPRSRARHSAATGRRTSSGASWTSSPRRSGWTK